MTRQATEARERVKVLSNTKILRESERKRAKNLIVLHHSYSEQEVGIGLVYLFSYLFFVNSASHPQGAGSGLVHTQHLRTKSPE